MHNDNLKIWSFNLIAFIFSISNIETDLKIVSLILAIGYTIRKWYLMEKNKQK